MKELNRTDRLTIASIIIVLILVIGLITIKWNELRFSRSIGQSITMVKAAQDIISPEDVATIAKSGDNDYFLLDLRSPVDYQKSHIGNAFNIPIQKILENENLHKLRNLAKKSVTVIIYGEDQLKANSAWVLLKQLGFDNIKVMRGGYDYFSSAERIQNLQAMPGNLVEEPKYDFKAVQDSLSAGSPAENNTVTGEPVQLIKRNKKSKAEGGC
jgi:rhodanese-related sulfurtransferase